MAIEGLLMVQLRSFKNPQSFNTTSDWKNGDYETAIGSAGHMGHKEMANFLINKGARFDLFVLIMLGKTESVKPFIEAYLSLIYSIGPHGYTFLHHGKQESEDAQKLYKYFLSKGLKETFIKTFK
jgi:hypothetical protein